MKITNIILQQLIRIVGMVIIGLSCAFFLGYQKPYGLLLFLLIWVTGWVIYNSHTLIKEDEE